MKIEKYPCTVWEEGGWRVRATVDGPKLEKQAGNTWEPATVGSAAQVLLRAYHALLQQFQVPNNSPSVEFTPLEEAAADAEAETDEDASC